MPADSLPDVSVVILNFDGRHIIDRCLQSALALDYPSDRLEVIVCDNGSSDGSVEYVRTRFPSVRLVPLDRNYGFAEGNNRALAACRFQWVAFINNDMWFAPSWLRKLVAPLATQPALACIAGRILNWDGSQIDFVGGGVSFEGHGFHLDQGLGQSDQDKARRVIAPCGGAMLIRRDLFHHLGGFDRDYFSFFEDTDLGWRLNLLGHDVWYTPEATVFHRQHATARRFPAHQLRVLYERNALFTIYKCLGDANLAVALPTAMMLMNERALRTGRLGLKPFAIPSDSRRQADSLRPEPLPARDDRLSEEQPVTARARRVLGEEGWGMFATKGVRYLGRVTASALRRPLLAGGGYLSSISLSHYVALHEFATSLETLQEKRRWLQAHRVRTDAELIPLLQEPLHPSWDDPAYVRFYRRLTHVMGIDERFTSGR